MDEGMIDRFPQPMMTLPHPLNIETVLESQNSVRTLYVQSRTLYVRARFVYLWEEISTFCLCLYVCMITAHNLRIQNYRYKTEIQILTCKTRNTITTHKLGIQNYRYKTQIQILTYKTQNTNTEYRHKCGCVEHKCGDVPCDL